MNGLRLNFKVLVLLLMLLTGCLETSGTALPPRSIGGSVEGLSGKLTLFAIGSIVSVTQDGPFVFPNRFTEGTSYEVVLLDAPLDQTCTVENGSGIISGADVTNVQVTCTSQKLFRVGGNATGLAGEITLRNGTDTVTVVADGEFSFPVLLEDGKPYAAEVYQESANQGCFIAKGTGVINGADVTDVVVTCVSDDARLIDLVTSEGTLSPKFAPDTSIYFTDVPLLVSSISIIPTTSNPDAIIWVNDEVVQSAMSSSVVALDLGTNFIDVRVKAPGGAQRDYAVIVNREASFDTTYFKASNSAAADYFGSAVAIDGDILAVGATGEDSNATGINGNQSDNGKSSSGAVYVFIRAGGVWKQEAYIKSSNPDNDDLFGTSVAVHGNTLVVGAPGEDSNAKGVNGNQSDNGATNSGAVYVFVRDAVMGTWSQQAYIKASNAESLDVFGAIVAISGDTLAVGAPFENSNANGVNGDENDNGATDAGAVYVFVRSGATWTQEAYVKAANSGDQDKFGASIAIFGDTLAVGATDEDSNTTGINPAANDNAFEAGAAYVFVRSAGVWTQQAFVKASNADTGDRFGSAVALGADILVVGAKDEDSNAVGVGGDQANDATTDSGAVYVFRRIGTTWAQEGYLKASNTYFFDYFGSSVTISGDTLAVGSFRENGSSNGLNGDEQNIDATDSGAVYLFSHRPDGWKQYAYLKAPNSDAGDEFGKSIAISGSTLVCAAPLEDSNASGLGGNPYNNALAESGAVFVYR